MQKSDYPYLADWYSISFRWLVLLGLTVSLALFQGLGLATGLVILLAVGWNMFITGLSATYRCLPWHRLASVAGDGVIFMALFFLSGTFYGPILWGGVLVLFSAGIYFDILGGVLAGLAMSIIECGSIYLLAPTALPLAAFGIVFIANLVAGLLLGLYGHFLMNRVGSSHGFYLNERRELEKNAQRQEHDRMQAIYNLIAALGATLNYETVLNEALDLGAQAMAENKEAADQMVSAVLLFENNRLKLGSTRRISPSDQHLTLPGLNGIIGQAVQSADPQITNDPINDPELSQITTILNCQSAACLALRSGLDVYGLLLFAHPLQGFFTPARCEVLEVIKQQAGIAIQNSLLYQNLATEKTHLIEIQEETRHKLARDLHDGPTQSVSAIAMRINYARRLMAQDPKAAVEEMDRIEDLARRTTKEIRHMLFTLRPLMLESKGLIAALTAMAEKMKETYDQNVSIEVDPVCIEDMEIGKQTVIFYIIEEAVNNARKHAQAAHIWVCLSEVPKAREILVLKIQDDGVGFDVAAINSNYENRGSLGMINLHERSDLINGLLNIQSAKGKGTRVQVFIPTTEEAADRLHRTT